MLEQIKVGPIFPPYQLGAFQRCPALWDLGKRWKKSESSPRTATLIGNAVALGLEKYYTGMGNPIEVAEEYVEAYYKEGSDKSLKGCKGLAKAGVELGKATDLGIKDVLAVEKFYGRIKPDLVIRTKADELVVVDHKVKIALDDRWVEKELQTYDHSNQFFHYAWGVSNEHGEQVRVVVAHLIVLSPVPKTIIHPVLIDERHLAYWLKGAAHTWNLMKNCETSGYSQPNFEGCRTPYGLCDFYEGCHTLDGDESQFEQFYERSR